MNTSVLVILLACWIITWLFIIFLRYREELFNYLKEPVLKRPVLIFESDDWGAGPLIQSQVLTRISSLLAQFTDKYSHHPVMTLGVVLSVPHVSKIKATKFQHYYALKLEHSVFSPIKKAMEYGMFQGVFCLQLHGMAHFWPKNLMRALQADDRIRHWLDQNEFPETEALPSVLQSRWINTEELPSIPLSQDEIDYAVKEEVDSFGKLFGFSPKVVVPPTFIWSEPVERSWKQQSVSYLVTPGRRFDCRDTDGKPFGPGKKIVNGQLSDSGLTYIVRNDYLEPSLGHTAGMAIKALTFKANLAQPALFEIHRFNFIQDEKTTEISLKELETVILRALAKYPNLMFLSTQELADKYSSKDKDLIEQSYFIRLMICLKRIWANQAIRKWLYLGGIFPLFFFFYYYRKK